MTSFPQRLGEQRVCCVSCALTLSYSLTMSSMTMLWYLRFMMAAMVSSRDFMSVGPNTTPRLLAAIRFLAECAATLKT